MTKNTPPLSSKYMEMVSLYIEQKLPVCKIVCEYMHFQIIFVADCMQGDFRIIQWATIMFFTYTWLFICASLKQTQFSYIYLYLLMWASNIFKYLTGIIRLVHIDGIEQDCSNSNASTMELLPPCVKPSICRTIKALCVHPFDFRI